MNILYKGQYEKRFEAIKNYLKELPDGGTVLELCFGDVKIARFCQERSLKWLGLDINQRFVEYAKKHGFNAKVSNLLQIERLPKSDVVVMMGSLYHFHAQTDGLLDKMMRSTTQIIISEPVKNISAMPGILGWFARRMAKAGNGAESFRYSADTFLETISKAALQNRFRIDDRQELGKDMIIKLVKNGNS